MKKSSEKPPSPRKSSRRTSTSRPRNLAQHPPQPPPRVVATQRATVLTLMGSPPLTAIATAFYALRRSSAVVATLAGTCARGNCPAALQIAYFGVYYN